jgi:hypothetical protein
MVPVSVRNLLYRNRTVVEAGASRFRPPLLRAALATGAGLLALVAFWNAKNAAGSGVDGLPLVMVWAAGIGLAVFAFRGSARGSAPSDRLPVTRGEAFLLAAVTATGAALRLYRIGEIPRVLDGDEGWLGLNAMNAARTLRPFATLQSIGGIYFRLVGWFLDTFGVTPAALRLPSAIGGTLAILATYLLARELFGRRPALLAAALLALSHAAIQYSRIASVIYTQGCWLAPLAAWLFVTGLRRESARRMAACGAVVAIHLAVYVDAALTAGFLVLFMAALAAFSRGRLPGLRRGAAVAAGVFLLAALPELVFAARRPRSFFERFSADGTLQNGWLQREARARGVSPAAIEAERVRHAYAALVTEPATVGNYGIPRPLLSPITATLLPAGLVLLVVRGARRRDPWSLFLPLQFAALTVAVGAFALPPESDAYRMTVAFPYVMILSGFAMDFGIRLLSRVTPGAAARLGVPACVLLTVFSINFRLYYGDYAGNCLFTTADADRFAYYLGQYARDLPPDTSVYLLCDDTLRYGTHYSVDFLMGRRSVVNWREDVSTLTIPPKTALVAVPRREDELEAWARKHPGGRYLREHHCDDLILVAYIPPDSAALASAPSRQTRETSGVEGAAGSP